VIVSDVDLRFRLGRTALWRAGVERHAVSGAEAAAEACHRLHPQLVVMDGRDHESALMLVRRLRGDAQARQTGIAVLSRRPTLTEEAELRAAGANVVFAGRVDPQVWDARLEELLNVPSRRAARIPIRFVTWSRAESEPEPVEGLALNISVNGILMETPGTLEVGTRLEISFRLPGGDRELHALAEVVRDAGTAVGHPRSGVKFLVLRDGARERIQEFVEAAIGSDARGASEPAAEEPAAWRALLRASEARKGAVLDSVLDGIITVDVEGRIVEFNHAAEELFGHRRQDVVGRPLVEVLVPRALRERHEGLAGHLGGWERHSSGSRVETTAWRADGSEVPVELAVTPVRGERSSHFTLCLRDISARRRAEEVLRSSARQFRALFEGARDAMFVTDGDGRCLEANHAACALLAAPREALLGHWLGDFVDPGFAFEQAWQAFRSEGTASGELPLLGAGRTQRTVEFTASADFLPGSHLVEMRDVTDKRMLEEQYRHSQKMEAVGRLAGGVAHDFNNLLNVIIGYGDLVLRGLAGESPLRAKVQQIQRAADRAAGLTRQLLAFSRRQVLQPRVLELNQVVGDATQMLGRLVGDDVELVTDLSDDAGSVKADPGQLEQVLVNLVVNARDAMPAGGRIAVRTRRVELESSRPWGGEQAPAGAYVQLEVQDSGEGMTSETQRHIFEPFFTTKKSGTGLGLATVYGIVKQSDGFIQIESRSGEGASFRIILPRLASSAALSGREDDPSPRPRGAETVLLVEDQDLLLGMMREVLEGAGYRVLEARNGEEALRLQARHEGEIDLLLTDLVMPGMGGAELARRFAAVRPGTRLMFISGYTDDAAARRGIQHPNTAFLQKPFTTETLERKLREVLDAPPRDR
jgi:PAS domain S-box-containing protein